MLHLFKTPPLFTSGPGKDYPIDPTILNFNNPACTAITCLDGDNIRLTLEYDAGYSIAVGNGIRVSTGVKNEVVILCTGAATITPDITAIKFSVDYAQNKKSRVITFIMDSAGYTLNCRQVIIESHTQYVQNDDGTRRSLEETIDVYRKSAPNMQEWLNNLKKQRDAKK